jgi:hypothetical protein
MEVYGTPAKKTVSDCNWYENRIAVQLRSFTSFVAAKAEQAASIMYAMTDAVLQSKPPTIAPVYRLRSTVCRKSVHTVQ